MRTAILLSWLLGIGLPQTESAAAAQPVSRSIAALRKEAREAHDRGDKAKFLAIYEGLVRRSPGNIFLLYNLACGQALNGRSDAAVATLEDILTHKVASNLDLDGDFESIRQTEGYKRVLAAMNAFRKERVTSGAVRAFTIPEKGFIAEGVAYDPVPKAFFVSSVRHRKVVRVDAAGKIADFVPAGRDGLRSALGIRVDPQRRTLWVASEAIPSMDGYRKDQALDAAVFEYDADSGKLRRKHVPSGEDPPAAFDDLTVAPNGTVFVNDGRSGRIWSIPSGGRLQIFLASEAFDGTQGMVVSENGKTLYVSDYEGLFAVDIGSRRVTPISVPPALSLGGVDGLARFENSLIAIQNGIIPHRVIRLDLAPDGLTVAKASILEMNHPDLDEPTLGVVVDGFLYFSADSQGQKFLDPKRPIRADQMRDAVILKLPLAASGAAAR